MQEQHKDSYIIFNNTGKNLSFDLNVFFDSDPPLISKHKRRRLDKVNRVNCLLKKGTTVDLVELTGLSYEELKEHKEVQDLLLRNGSNLMLVEVSFSYEFDPFKYIDESYKDLDKIREAEIFIQPNKNDFDVDKILEKVLIDRKIAEEALNTVRIKDTNFDKTKKVKKDKKASKKPSKVVEKGNLFLKDKR